MHEVQIIGTGSFVPEKVITNDDLSKIVETSDEWIFSRTGIKERRISTKEDTSHLAVKAAQKALKNSEISKEDIDLIIVATMTPDYFMPSTACLVQKEIGAVNATCFDVSGACTGFIYALNTGFQYIRTGQSKIALIIGADTYSKILDWSDRSTCVLFGDGAGAVVLKQSTKKGIISIYTGSDGTGDKLLTCPAVSLNNPFAENIEAKKSVVSMNGKEVYRFATTIVPRSIEKVLENTIYKKEDIDHYILHQANARMMDVIAKKMDISIDKFYKNIDKYGNTSAGSIPIAIDEMNHKSILKKDDLLILVGFGGGLTWGSVLLQWNI
ncbi:beta-ketoacyl-ACP synthase III [Defluviitalea phaphyphila]|uniref:beta-ketoacyl-ACP synthase III n=1 Tax=Defluviitalea phaphyphila TaxID=1473580 RepID=UPI000730F751|nr:beta-ketoacyl-ACP synthase III [Defluviitalea phaphyphila]